MSEVWFCSDLHVSHKNIAKFRKEVNSESHNREVIKHHWDKIISKRDLVWCLGDSAFDEEGIDWIGTLSGKKRLVRGNHCDCPTTSYLRVFEEVYGLVKYKGMWLSHAPIHPSELRGKPQCHGHTHYFNMKKQKVSACGEIYYDQEQDDTRYLNCSVENLMRNLGRPLINLREVKHYFATGKYVVDDIVTNRIHHWRNTKNYGAVEAPV